jgi:hypothetical protein
MGYLDLGYAVVQQAVEDYRENKADKRATSRLKRFFKSKWCNELLTGASITGEEILAKLESE